MKNIITLLLLLAGVTCYSQNGIITAEWNIRTQVNTDAYPTQPYYIHQDSIPEGYFFAKLVEPDTLYYRPGYYETVDTVTSPYLLSSRPDTWPTTVVVKTDTVGIETLEEYLHFNCTDSSAYYSVITTGDIAVINTELRRITVEPFTITSHTYQFKLPPPTYYFVYISENGEQDYIKLEKNGDIIVKTGDQEVVIKNTRLAKKVWENYRF